MSEIITDESRTGRKAPGHVKQEKSVNSETRAKHKERKISISGKSLKLTNLTKITGHLRDIQKATWLNITAYSARPRPSATVSTPLLWNEVNHQLSPEMFTIRNILKRLEKTGDLWRPVLGKGISLIKALNAIEKL